MFYKKGVMKYKRLIQLIFSLKNSADKKILTILGIKIYFKNRKKKFSTINFGDVMKKDNYIFKIVDIIVPVYNGYDYLDKLFSQIKENTDLEYNLFVIDDCSTDERVFPLLKKYESIFDGKMHLIKNDCNLGFLKTVNRALALTQNDVCLLNTDVQLPKNWASRLMYYIFANDDVASVTPFSNAATIFSFPRIFIDNAVDVDFNKIDKWLSVISLENLPVLDFPTGVGFCFAMSRKALDGVGVFDEIFEKGYGEENDWCMRARKIGFKNTLCPNLFVYHKHGGSFDSHEKKILSERHLQIINKRYPDYAFLVFESSKSANYLAIRFIASLFYYSNYAKRVYLYKKSLINKKAISEKINSLNSDELLIVINTKINASSATLYYRDNKLKLFINKKNNIKLLLDNIIH